MQRSDEFPEVLRAPAPPTGADVPALVLNVGRLVLHHGGLGIIRSLGRMGVPVYATIDDRFTPSAVSRYLTGAFIWDTRHLDEQRFLNGMALIGTKLGRPTILIPTGDVAAILIAEHAAALQRWFLFPSQPVTLPRALANKRELYQLCQRIGVDCPQSAFPQTIDDVRQFAARAKFPVMVKAAESWQLPEGGRSTSLARTPEQLDAIYQATESPRRPNFILQEFIDPAHGEDWFYHGYRNERSNCRVGFTGQKLRCYPPYSGPTTLGKSVENGPLRERAEALLDAIAYGGIVDLDYRLDRRDGRYKLLDFNPRIGAQFRLFEDRAGIDVARAMYLDLTGRRVLASGSADGRTFIAEFHDVAASVGYFRLGKLTFRDWRRSLRGYRELAWFSRDDTLPFLLMCILLMFRVAERLLRLKPAPHGGNGMPRYVTRRGHRVLHGTQERRERRKPRSQAPESSLAVHS